MRIITIKTIFSLLFAAFSSVCSAATETSGGGDGKAEYGFFELYQQNRELGRPNYITADFWLLAYSLVRQATFSEIEQGQIKPLLAGLITQLSESYTADTDDAAVIANNEYLTILTALLNGQKQLSSSRAQQELDLIIAAQGIASSPLWGLKMDYSQFKPRGRYAENAQDRQYFRAMRYAGTVLLAIKPSAATGVSEAMAARMTRQALLLAQQLQHNETAKTLEQLLGWQMGSADDLLAEDVIKATKALDKPTLQRQQQALLSYARQQGKQPKIIAGVVDVDKLEKGVSVADVMTGFRLMPLRYSADNAVFQQLIYPNTVDYIDDCKDCPKPFGLSHINGKSVKGYPSAYELMALLNSAQARQQVVERRENQFEQYARAERQAQNLLAKASGLNGAQLTLLSAWFKQTDANTESGQDKLIAALGFWTWQRYTELLYSKQSYSLVAKSMHMKAEDRPGARLESATELYRSLSALIKLHQQYTPHRSWQGLQAAVTAAVALSEKPLDQLDEKDNAFLNELDKSMLSYTLGLTDKPIVVDVHTNPGENRVVEEAVGWSRVVTQDQAIGARFSHAEFKQPLDQRLDDAGWLEKLKTLK